MIREISKEHILDKIQNDNPWWINGHIEQDINELTRRPYIELLKPLVYQREINRAVVLMGPRRVGKTYMLYHMVEDLIQNGVPPQKIIFIKIDNPIYLNISLEQLFAYAKEASGLKEKDDWYVIYDEIQYCANWEVHLKTLVDSYRKCKFIASGSAAAALKLASNESGAGRFTDFSLPPLTFYEYISLKGLDHIIQPHLVKWPDDEIEIFSSPYMDEFNKHFLDYINFGGYPEAVFSKEIQADPGRYIKHDIIDKVLLKDIPGLYGISDTMELNSLFVTIAFNSGAEFSLETLSRQSQVPKNTLKKYIEYLEAAFLIKRVKRIDQSGKRFKRDHFFKIYLTNPSLRGALFTPITSTDEMIGNLVEMAIFSQWITNHWFTPWYARWANGEVDMVELNAGTLKPAWALEIKWTNRYFDKPNELKSLLKFCSENKLDRAIVTTLDKEGQKMQQCLTLQFVPSASYAYTIGKNTLMKKRMFGG